ncbi:MULTISPECIES: hypothetical protein [Anaerolinea]|nr:hypothetical protein [Anaerolinea thermophila]
MEISPGKSCTLMLRKASGASDSSLYVPGMLLSALIRALKGEPVGTLVSD